MEQENKWTAVTLEIRPDQHKRLKELAERDDRSMVSLVRLAIDRELTRRERQIELRDRRGRFLMPVTRWPSG